MRIFRLRLRGRSEALVELREPYCWLAGLRRDCIFCVVYLCSAYPILPSPTRPPAPTHSSNSPKPPHSAPT